MDFIKVTNKTGGTSYVRKSCIVSIDEEYVDDVLEAARLGTASIKTVTDTNGRFYLFKGDMEELVAELSKV